jgi:hypothetical protein
MLPMLAISKTRANRKLAIQRPLGTRRLEISGKGLFAFVFGNYAASLPFSALLGLRTGAMEVA